LADHWWTVIPFVEKEHPPQRIPKTMQLEAGFDLEARASDTHSHCPSVRWSKPVLETLSQNVPNIRHGRGLRPFDRITFLGKMNEWRNVLKKHPLFEVPCNFWTNHIRRRAKEFNQRVALVSDPFARVNHAFNCSQEIPMGSIVVKSNGANTCQEILGV
jgi:hypothetical protein